MVKSAEDLYRVDEEVSLGVDASKLHFFGGDERRFEPNDPRAAGYLELLRRRP
ncbi:hypothetical protein D1872_299980 [compost metagenome]